MAKKTTMARPGGLDVEAAIAEARGLLDLLRFVQPKYGSNWKFYQDVDTAVRLLEHADDVIYDVIYAPAAAELQQKLNVRLNVERERERARHFRNDLIATLRQARPPAAAKRGQRPGRLPHLFLRDQLIAETVIEICEQYGFNPTRNPATDDHESGCSIVKVVLEQDHGLHLSEGQLNDIYTDRGFDACHLTSPFLRRISDIVRECHRSD
jgi:hypothetical protein